MSGVGVNKPPEEINRLLVKFLPELDSEYGKYPMMYQKWYQTNEKGPKGQPVFIKDEEGAIKKDYVYCKRAPAGPGYYHLLTKTAYINLYSRHSSSCPVGCCAVTSDSRKAYDEWDDVKRIVHARQLSNIPNDNAAATKAMDEAKGTAQAWHNGMQNEQFVVMAAT